MTWQIERRFPIERAHVDGGGRTVLGPWEPMPGYTGFASRLAAQEAFVNAMDPQTRGGSPYYIRAHFRWMSGQTVRVAKATQ